MTDNLQTHSTDTAINKFKGAIVQVLLFLFIRHQQKEPNIGVLKNCNQKVKKKILATVFFLSSIYLMYLCRNKSCKERVNSFECKQNSSFRWCF